MRTSFITLFGLVASAVAIPAKIGTLDARQTGLCTEGTPQCCSVDVLGIADLDCANPPTVPANTTDFNTICAEIGQIDMCCVLPILDQGIICSAPIGG